jgi:LysR family glycine cleavage system transcriptional activator
LLSARARSAEWHHWFDAQRIKLPPSQRFITYESIALVIDASIAGVGIALVDQALISDDLRQRRLRVLLDTPVSGLGAYYIVMPKSKNPDPKTIVFRDWLISEAARDTC